MTAEQAKILKQFIHQVAELADDTLTAFVEREEKQVSIATGSHRASEPERLLNKKELAGRLGVSVRTICALQTEGLPTVKFGKKRIQFNYDKVLTWLEGKEIKNRPKTNLRVIK